MCVYHRYIDAVSDTAIYNIRDSETAQRFGHPHCLRGAPRRIGVRDDPKRYSPCPVPCKIKNGVMYSLFGRCRHVFVSDTQPQFFLA